MVFSEVTEEYHKIKNKNHAKQRLYILSDYCCVVFPWFLFVNRYPLRSSYEIVEIPLMVSITLNG